MVLKNRLEQFKKRQREDAAKVQAELGASIVTAQTDANAFGGDMHADVGNPDDADDEMDEDDFIEEYDPEMSPAPLDPREMQFEERRLPIIDEGDNLRSIVSCIPCHVLAVAHHAVQFDARRSITEASFVPRHVIQRPTAPTTSQSVIRPSAADIEAERIYREEAQREKNELGSDESEEEFGDLDETLNVAVPSTYDWSDRYRPRKPRFFNRVHTGYEWSKYNQTHYDTDNPPPKVVQGYKFNIFYPDLIDKRTAPTYYIKRIPDDPDTQMIVFTAGPPYEDIAFRIVRRPWEYSHRKGFRSLFDRGVLQLYFNFGRSFYRK